MNVVGLDLSLTGTGVCYNGIVSTVKPGNKLRDEPRLSYIISEIFAKDFRDSFVAIEGLAYSSNVGKATERAGLWWLVKMQLWYANVPVAIVAPPTRCKYITGSGRSDKDTVMLAAAKTFPDIKITNNNEADAAVLYAMAKDHLGEPIADLPALNRSSLKSVVWP